MATSIPGGTQVDTAVVRGVWRRMRLEQDYGIDQERLMITHMGHGIERRI